MSLKDALEVAEPGRHGPKCSVCQLLAELPQGDRVALQQALESSLAESAIFRAIKSEGFYVGKGAVGRHRRGDCAGL